MSNAPAKKPRAPRAKKIFISWSGPNSKEFAKAFKHLLEESVFDGVNVKCFMSDEDILSGSDWWEKIKKEVRACKLGIICITKENMKAPWIYFEAGAMAAKEKKFIPLLISCDPEALASTPLNHTQIVSFYDEGKFLRMLEEINRDLELGLDPKEVKRRGKAAHERFRAAYHPMLRNLKDMRVFNEKYVYPSEVTTVKQNTIFVGAPMSSIPEAQYNELRAELVKVKKVLTKIGFTEVYCPMIDKESPKLFDGRTKAIKNNFPIMKRVDSMLFVCPWNVPSSALVEMGYGVALSKRMVVFYREKLPYIMSDAGNSISHIKSYHFSSYSEIIEELESTGLDLFTGG